MSSSTWLVKSEPSTYSFDALLKDKKTRWDGIRNFTARNYLRAMKVGDVVLYYHSGDGKEIVGLAQVAKDAYPDPTAESSTEDWSAVDLVPLRRLEAPVTLATVKATAKLGKMLLVKQSRLSVMPVTRAEFDEILRLGKTKLSALR